MSSRRLEGLKTDLKFASPSSLEYQYTLFRNSLELFKSDPRSVELSGAADFKRIPIRQRVLLDNAVQPGDYVLLLQVKDKQAKEKHNVAAQALDFEVLAAGQAPSSP